MEFFTRDSTSNNEATASVVGSEYQVTSANSGTTPENGGYIHSKRFGIFSQHDDRFILLDCFSSQF